MAVGKPYRYGLIVAGLCVAAAGLFIMTQERPHIYATVCAIGVSMLCVGTMWSLCQCYPKVDSGSCVHPEALPGFCGQKSSSSSRLLPEALKSQCHSCPTLHLV
uniref:Barttin n=1 Tax=Echeneis naucrates TaxID=173247 RepID=A0A665VUG4_ECHNA